MPVNTTIKIRKGTQSEWQSSNPILASGEPGFVIDTNRFKIGDGSTSWNSLNYAAIVPTGLIAGNNVNINLGANGSTATIGVSGAVQQSQSLVTSVFNETGSTLSKMTAVYINGGQGDTPTIQKAIATSDMTSAGTYGLVYEDIDNMEIGQVVVFGSLSGVNTDPAHGGIAGATEGSVLYLSPTVSGAITTTKPHAPDHIVAIGTVVRVHQNEGVIEVRVQNGFELEELHDVAVTGVTDSQFLQYNSASGLWVPSSSGNFTTLQVSGIPVPTGTGSLGHVAYWTGANSLSYDSNQLYWDSSNNRLGVGTNNPQQLIHISGASTALAGIRLDNSSGQGGTITAANNMLYFNSAFRVSSSKIRLGDGGSAGTIELTSGGSISQDGNGGGLTFSGTTGRFSNNLEVTGNLTVNNSGVPVGSGAANHVAYWSSNSALTHDSGQLYWDATNNRLGIGTSSPTSSLTVSGTIQLTDTAGNRVQFFRGGGTVYDYSIAKEGNHLAISTANDGSTFRYTQFGYHAGSTWTPKTVVNNYNGKVGIVNTTPSYELDVTGSGHFTQNLLVDGDCVIGPLKAYKWNGNAWGYDRIIFRSDVNNKITSDANGNYDWLVAGRNWTLSDVGNVGIKTSSPSRTLHVVGSGYFDGYLDVDNLRLDGNTIISTNSNGNVIISATGTGKVGINTSSPTHTLHINGSGYVSNGFRIDNTLGIGKNATLGALDVQGCGAFGQGSVANIIIGDDCLGGEAGITANRNALDHCIGYIFGTDDSYRYGGTYGSEYLIISSGGLVGIGTSSPSYNLHVIGTGNFSQNLLVNGTAVSISGHSHVVTDITDFSTGVANEVSTTLAAGSGIALDYNSGTDTLTIHTSGVKSKTLTYFTPLDNQPPATNFATLDTRNSIAVLDFDDTTEESAVFVGVLPENASLGSGISVRIHWMATSATTGSCRWGVQFEKMNTDLDSDSFDTATEAHSTTNGTSGIITITSMTCTSIDSLVAGDLFRIKIYRDVSDTTNDTMTGDAEIVAVELRSIL